MLTECVTAPGAINTAEICDAGPLSENTADTSNVELYESEELLVPDDETLKILGRSLEFLSVSSA